MRGYWLHMAVYTRISVAHSSNDAADASQVINVAQAAANALMLETEALRVIAGLMLFDFRFRAVLLTIPSCPGAVPSRTLRPGAVATRCRRLPVVSVNCCAD